MACGCHNRYKNLNHVKALAWKMVEAEKRSFFIFKKADGTYNFALYNDINIQGKEVIEVLQIN